MGILPTLASAPSLEKRIVKSSLVEVIIYYSDIINSWRLKDWKKKHNANMDSEKLRIVLGTSDSRVSVHLKARLLQSIKI